MSAPADPSRYDHGERLTWKCQKCDDCTINATEVRMRAAGWRIWNGESATGKPLEVRICPACAIGDGVNDKGERVGYDAICHTCGEAAGESDDLDDDPWTEKDAKDWMRDHECEPNVELIKPKPTGTGATYTAPARAMAPTDVVTTGGRL